MKKRVMAAAMMLLVAAIVSVTAAYAWMTLSVAPVVSSVNTTMSANGTLEIALSNPEGTEPEEMDIDESVSASTDVKVTNLQWGNLINLSDSSYGIDNLVLRPAQLNTASLKNSPLWGAVYGSDGRITTLDSNYTFMKWKEVAGQGTGDFMYSDEYGVRAIASYTVTVSEGTNAEYTIMSDAVVRAQNAVENAYADVAPKMADLSTMISSFAQGVVNEKLGSDTVDPFSSKDIQDVYNLFVALLNAMELEKDAMVTLANFQSFVAAQDPTSNHTHVTLTWDDLVANKANYNAASTATTSKNGIISITGLTQFITDLNTVTTDTAYLERYYQNATTDVNNTDTTKCVYYWDSTEGLDSGYQISNIVQRLISWTTMTMVIDGAETRLTSLSMDTAMSLAFDLNGEDTNIYVYDSILMRFEQTAIDRNRIQGRTNGAVITVKVSAIGQKITVYGCCYTKAADSSYFMTDYMAALGEKLLGSDVVGEDTYGMAVDFWLRTNAEETYLTLEGAIATEEDGTVYSYDGINRVWGATGDEMLTTNSTTQGGGSCYIYYADTPEDMMRSLQLLKSMKVAFVDNNGKLLAQASMDTDNYYAVNGRITVPLAVETTSGVAYTYTDTDGTTEKTGRAVTLMTHDEPLWVTAIIYLDGAYLGNDDVLAANHIDGQLNIQFGSSVDLQTLGDNKLLVAERVVTAEVSPTELNWATAMTAEQRTTNVTVTIDGTDANNVEAFFIRAINSTQGERQDTMTFTESSTEGTWTSSYEFTAPGTYYLRHVRLDGVDYALENPPKVVVKGFDVASVTWDQSGDSVTVYSPENYYEAKVTAKVTTDNTSKPITSVQARFLRDDGIMVNADLTHDIVTDTWSGTGTFYRSGTYELQYLLVNGDYYDVTKWGKELELYLGLSVSVYNNGSSTEDLYDANVEEGTYSKDVGVKITDNDGNDLPVYEYDENGNATMADWAQSVILRYSQGGSASATVDATLTWNDTHSWFEGTLPITKPGRYVFQSLRIGATGSESTLSRVTEYPTYVIYSPDPPEYVTSESTFSAAAGEVQYAQLVNNAFIGPITIDNAASASVSAVVYNSVTEEEYTITMGSGAGQMEYSASGWRINLPVYTDNGVETQEGVWSVKQISVWDCYDGESNYRDEENPIVWTDADVDFTKLTTDVSATLNITMTPGDTTLGDKDAAFMTAYKVQEIGMSVKLTDGRGNPIPQKVANLEFLKDVSLDVSYAANTNLNYGYATTDGAEYTGTNAIKLNNYNASTGVATVSSEYYWQDVGEYKVTGLTVNINGVTRTVDPKSNGVPEMYTVTSMAPTPDNLWVTSTSQKTVLGKDSNGTVTGTFLQSYGGDDLPAIGVKLAYKAYNATTQTYEWEEATNAIMPDLTVSLTLSHKSGTSSTYGNYTWSGTNNLSYIENLEMKLIEGYYKATSTNLLAGVYTPTVTMTMSNVTKSVVPDGKTAWDNISVYSMSPTVTMTAVSPTTQVTVNRDAGVRTSTNTFPAYNAIVNDGKNALVYIGYTNFTADNNVGQGTYYGTSTEHSETLADYSLPSIQFKLTNAGAVCSSFALTIPNESAPSKPNTVAITTTTATGTGTSKLTEIGAITTGKWSYDPGDWAQAYHYVSETPHAIGTQTIGTISATHNGVTYTMTLSDTFTIVQKNEAAPSISMAGITYDTGTSRLEFAAVDGAVSDDGLPFTFKLPTQDKYQKLHADYFGNLVIDNEATNDGWTQYSRIEGTQYAIYTGVGSIVSGYPQLVSHTTSGITGKIDNYTYSSQYNFNFDTYQRYNITYKRTGTVTTYDAVYGLTGWTINGTAYAPGATVTVNSVNTVAEPIIGKLSQTEKSRAYSEQMATTYIDSSSGTISVPGSVKQGTGTHLTASTASSQAQTNANAAASADSAKINPTGYTIITSTSSLQLTETAKVLGEWTDIS